jgi:Tropinone reductase 1
MRAVSQYCPVGQRVLVTGGTQGIGRAVVEELGRVGARVFTCARNAGDLAGLVEQAAQQGWDVQGVVGDVATPEGREEVVKAVSQAFGGQLGEGAGCMNSALPHTVCAH